MTPERWQHLKALLDSALELKPAERAAFLADACGDDEALREDLQSLLVHEEQASSFIEQPAFGVMAATLTDEQATTMLGRTLGRYRIIAALGSGGMGEVYLAEDTQLGRKIALKILPAHFTVDDERVRRFQQEARAASALNHPNIITIYEIGHIDSRHFIVTEFIEGETLRQQMAKIPMVISEVLDVAAQVASALATAHQAGIAHRDIKPENIMLRADGIAKVLDFGLAKLTEQKSLTSDSPTLVKTAQGMVMGTAHYMSPEQARGLPVDARTDIWSLGVVLFEMVGGRVPFEGATSSDVIASILDREPTPLARYSPEAPTELEWIVKKALRKDREERYQTAKELLSDLKGLKRRLEFEQEMERTMDSGPKSAGTAWSPGYVSSGADRTKAQAHGWGSRRVIDSLAILPLINASPDPSLEYLSDGITESIINSLSQLPHIRVMARSSVFRYKGRDVGPKEIGRELGVRAVLTGRVLQVGERLVVGTELIDATDETQLWGKHYQGNLSDIFEVQEEIAHEISEALRLRLTGTEQRRLAKRYTDNTEAYQLYLKGLHFFNKRSVEGYNKAIEYYQQAIEKDPNYAMAYAGLADCYANCSVAELLPKEAITQGRAAATRALEIDDTLAEAHNALAHLKLNLEWDWPGAETAFQRALELNPNYSEAHHRYSHYLVAMGRFEESLTESLRGLELDPLDITMNTHLGWHYLMARQDDQAIEQLKKTLELDQSFVRARLYLGQAYERTGVFGKAIAEIEKVRTVYGPSQMATSLLGHAYATAGKRYEAEKLIEELKEQSKREFVWPYHLAIIWIGLGEKDRAIEYLEKAYGERSEELIYLNVERMFDSLRSEPRFTNLVRRMGLLWVEGIQPATSLTTRGAWHVSAEADRAGPQSQGQPARKVIDSLAILPLANSTADPSLEYFSDGITESIIGSLSQLAGLRVMAWSTVSRYKGRDVDPRELGRDLGVHAVLTGRVVQAGERLVIKTELVNAMDGSHLWGQSYSCDPSEILDIEAEISRAISEKLLVRLTTAERKQLTRRYPDNVEAYHAYLKGRYFWNKRSEEGLKKGIEHFQQAIDEDPGYAAAFAGMSDCYTMLVVRYGLPSGEGNPKAKAAAMKALEIDGTLAEAHTSLAHSLLHNWEWDKAEREFKRAVELNPNDANAHNFYGEYLRAMGRAEQAISAQKRAQELDPLSLNFSTNVANELYFARRYDEAIAQCRKALEMDRNFFLAHYRLGQAYEKKGMFDEAITALQRAVELSPDNVEMLAALGRALAVAGRREEARRIVDQLETGMEHRHSWHYDTALIYAGLGEDNQAFKFLEKGYAWRDGMMIHLNVEPRFDSLRSDPRFQDLVRRMGLPPIEISQPPTLSSPEQRTETTKAQAARSPTYRVLTQSRWRRPETKIVLALLIVLLAGGGYLLWFRGETKQPSTLRNATFTQLTDQPGPEFFPSLSPDARSLAYASRASGNWDIYLQSVGGRSPINLTKDSPADDTQPAFSPDGNRIAFRSERDGGGIFLMGANGESVTRVSDFGYSPAWSPNGQQILVGTEKIPQPSTRPSKSQLWAINTRTNERRLVTEGDALQPNCSPNVNRIAFWSRPSKTGQRDSIWTIPAAGGDAVAVTDGTTTDSNPVWSPDGKFLYFSSNRGGSVNIWRVGIDEKSGAVSGQPEAVTTIGAATSALQLSVARDGRQLAYIAQEEIRNLRKISFDPSSGKATSEPISITKGSMQLWFPDVSPDGEWLTCYSMGNQGHIFIMRTDGSELRDLTDDTFRHFWPRWSPDGKRIAFSSRRSGNYEIWAINRDGSGLQQLTRDHASPGAHYSAWSPDGKRIAYSIHVPKNECILFEPDKAWNEQKLEYLPPLGDASISFEGWSWSRSGRKLAGIRHLPNGVHSGIGIYDLESKNYDWLTDFGDWPVWLNDDRRLLFVSEGKIFLFDTRTRKHQQILTVTDQDVDIGSPGLSPDNRTLYFTFVAAEADIWLMTLE